MKKFLVIGDPHVTADELPDCEKLMELVHQAADQERVDTVVILGDLHHNHSLVHVDVTDFWLKHLGRLANGLRQVVVMVGNHDRSTNDLAPAHALEPYRYIQGVKVVDRPFRDGKVGYIPYMADGVKFLEECRALSDVNTLFCHQTFDGTKFENGFYAKDAIDIDGVPQLNVISGHIHLPQRLGKVWYPGAPRWRTLSDANIDRDIWVIDLFDDGKPMSGDRRHTTAGHCREIRHTVYENGVLAEGPVIDDTVCRWHVDLKGSREQNRELAKELERPGLKFRFFDNDERQALSVRESEGVTTSFWKFFQAWTPPSMTDKTQLEKMARERLGWT